MANDLAGWLSFFLAALRWAHFELGVMGSVDLGSHALLCSSQHTEQWLESDKSHERSRAIQSIFLLLQFVVDSLKLAVSFLYPKALGST